MSGVFTFSTGLRLRKPTLHARLKWPTVYVLFVLFFIKYMYNITGVLRQNQVKLFYY